MQVETGSAGERFAALLGESIEGRQQYDRPLLDRPDWVAAPTLGAIIPNWLIIVPREPVLNFRVWKQKLGKAPQKAISDLGQHLGIASTDVVWFEHGPQDAGSAVGCGADYAHLHFLIRPSFTFKSFSQNTNSLSELDWKRTTFETAYDAIPTCASYLVAGSGDEVILASQVESTGSQFFRRVIAMISDRADAWDYKQYAHADNIAETIANFRALESTSRRGK